MDQLASLPRDSLRNRRMGMTQPTHGNTGERVQIALALGVRQPGTRAGFKRYR
jgi:hypothetical protein